MSIRKITDDLLFVGASDRRLALFESAYPVPEGVSYNAYLLRDEKNVLFDTVDRAVADTFLTATAEARAERRAKELAEKGQPADLATVLADIRQRDYQDSHRAVAPLKQAEDAILVDTSDIDLQESFDLLKRTILAHI